jgi:hypothetical protein
VKSIEDLQKELAEKIERLDAERKEATERAAKEAAEHRARRLRGSQHREQYAKRKSCLSIHS